MHDLTHRWIIRNENNILRVVLTTTVIYFVMSASTKRINTLLHDLHTWKSSQTLPQTRPQTSDVTRKAITSTVSPTSIKTSMQSHVKKSHGSQLSSMIGGRRSHRNNRQRRKRIRSKTRRGNRMASLPILERKVIDWIQSTRQRK